MSKDKDEKTFVVLAYELANDDEFLVLLYKLEKAGFGVKVSKSGSHLTLVKSAD